jgi:uncharacterized protein
MKHRIPLFLLLLICGISLPSLSGLLIIPFSIGFSGIVIEYLAALTAIFFVASISLHYRQSLKRNWQIPFAFFTASLALFLDFLINIPSNTINGLFLDMIVSASIIVSVITILTRVSGNSLSSIFIKKGKLKIGLVVGIIGFLLFAFASIPLSESLFGGRNLNFDRIFSWIPWIIPIVFLNGFREELLYRGLFLKKYNASLGAKTSNLLQALIFSLSHSVAGVGLNAYTPFIWALVAFTFVLGLAWGYLMQRTDSIIGSVLFHAGTDIPVFLGIFSTMF